jgi:hypothetical protein
MFPTTIKDFTKYRIVWMAWFLERIMIQFQREKKCKEKFSSIKGNIWRKKNLNNKTKIYLPRMVEGTNWRDRTV